jgi:maltose alpha-D-glucosyltransferase/alpha-amylase
MQWSPDRNAGFSRANPARLYSPVIMDPVYSYEAVNVEAQQSDPSSLLHWMRNMIALRKLFRVFGRGSMEFLDTGNRKVLAYVRRHEHEVILCVANLSRFAQPVALDLSAFEGGRPLEMLGYVEFPVVGRQPYAFTPGPYAFMWFELTGAPGAGGVAADTDKLSADEGWTGLFTGPQRARLEGEVLVRFLPQQRWFGGKSRRIVRAGVRDWMEIDAVSALVLIDVDYATGPAETYCLPLAMVFDGTDRIPVGAIVSAVRLDRLDGVLCDGSHYEPLREAMLQWIEQGRSIRGQHGALRAAAGAAFARLRGTADTPLPSVRAGAEQSNTSIIYDDRLILKLFRRAQPGSNPDVEVTRYLTETRPFDGVPPLAGTIEYVPDDGEVWDLGLLQGFVPNQGEGWSWTIETLGRYYEQCVPLSGEAAPPVDGDKVSLDSAAALGRRTADLHLALADAGGTPAFAPEPLDAAGVDALASAMVTNAGRMFEGLIRALPDLPDSVIETAGLVLAKRQRILEALRALSNKRPGGQRLRVHGDYHLGQVLRVNDDYAIIDFEGEPTRPLADRREKQSPLKDVANMLRSFSYAAWASLAQVAQREPEAFDRLEPWARLWEQHTATAFLRAYREAAGGAAFLPPSDDGLRDLLRAYLLDKACHEVLYELDNRPAWVWIPLRGLLACET